MPREELLTALEDVFFLASGVDLHEVDAAFSELAQAVVQSRDRHRLDRARGRAAHQRAQLRMLADRELAGAGNRGQGAAAYRDVRVAVGGDGVLEQLRGRGGGLEREPRPGWSGGVRPRERVHAETGADVYHVLAGLQQAAQ